MEQAAQVYALCKALPHHRIAIETSGTVLPQDCFAELGGRIMAIVSPKRQGKLPFLSEWLTQNMMPVALKMPVGRQDDLDYLDNLLEETNFLVRDNVFVQPISQSKKATDLCIDYCIKKGIRLSVQMHKYLLIQ